MYDYSEQVILLGDSGVGKTSFIVKYHSNEFRPASFSATVGIALTVSAFGFIAFKLNCIIDSNVPEHNDRRKKKNETVPIQVHEVSSILNERTTQPTVGNQ